MNDFPLKTWLSRLLARTLAMAALTAVSASAAAPPTMLVPRGSSWKYENSGTDLGTAWRLPGYNDSAWGGPSPGPLGDNLEGTVQMCTSVIDIGPIGARFPTIYFRKSFTVTSAEIYSGLIVR